MKDEGSVGIWLTQLKAGEAAALQPLCERYLTQLDTLEYGSQTACGFAQGAPLRFALTASHSGGACSSGDRASDRRPAPRPAFPHRRPVFPSKRLLSEEKASWHDGCPPPKARVTPPHALQRARKMAGGEREGLGQDLLEKKVWDWD